MSTEPQCCQNCVYWFRNDTNKVYGVCAAPVPDCVNVHSVEHTRGRDGKTCPCFERKEAGK